MSGIFCRDVFFFLRCCQSARGRAPWCQALILVHTRTLFAWIRHALIKDHLKTTTTRTTQQKAYHNTSVWASFLLSQPWAIANLAVGADCGSGLATRSCPCEWPWPSSSTTPPGDRGRPRRTEWRSSSRSCPGTRTLHPQGRARLL